MATDQIPPHRRRAYTAYRCTFCGATCEASALFAGTEGAYICVPCVEMLHEQIAGDALLAEARARRAEGSAS